MTTIHLDHAAATPIRPEVERAMDRARAEAGGNPSARHGPGRAARQLLSEARRRVAEALGVPARHVVFTRGGTEADNLAVLGRSRARPGHPVLLSALEHSAVRNAAGRASEEGAPVVELAVAPDGTVELPASPPTAPEGAPPALVSVQQVNSETGLRLELGPVRAWCAEHGLVLHVDAVQAPGRVPLPSPTDAPPGERLLLALSGHKLGGPRSAGVLVVPAAVELVPLLFGGAQERGLRAGTEDVESALGMAEALEAALRDAATGEPDRLARLSRRLEDGLVGQVPGTRAVVAAAHRAPHVLALQVTGVTADVLLAALDAEGVHAAAGSACRTGIPGPGPALRHLLGDEADRHAPLRLSLGRTTRDEDVDRAVPRVVRTVERIRSAGL